MSTILGGEPSYLTDNDMGVTILGGNTDVINTIDLSAVTGDTTINALTYDHGTITNALTIVGGTGPEDLLLGGSADGNTITANGTGTGFNSNQIFGGTGTDNTETGAGGAGGAETTFIFSALNQSSGQYGAADLDTITNFNPLTDTIAINPTTLTRGGGRSSSIEGTGLDGLFASLQRGPGGVEPEPDPHGEVLIATGTPDTYTLYIDANNDGNLNS